MHFAQYFAYKSIFNRLSFSHDLELYRVFNKNASLIDDVRRIDNAAVRDFLSLIGRETDFSALFFFIEVFQ